MMYKRVLYFLVFIFVLGFSSCDEILNVDIVGDGNLKTDTLEFSTSFSGIYLDSDFEIVLSSGEEQKIWIEAESNLLENDYINLVVEDDGVLNVGVKPNFNIAPRHPVRVYMQIPPESRLSEAEVVNGGTIIADSLSISEFSVSVLGISVFRGTKVICDSLEVFAEGSTTINIDGEFQRLSVHQKGSGNMVLTGNCDFSEILLEGSGKLDAKSMTMNDANISIYGSGLVLCRVPGRLSAFIDGSGRIYYYGGHPENLDEEIIGEGQILSGE